MKTRQSFRFLSILILVVVLLSGSLFTAFLHPVQAANWKGNWKSHTGRWIGAIRYKFDDTGEKKWTKAEKAVVREAISIWVGLPCCKISFEEVAENADITFKWKTPPSDGGTAGMMTGGNGNGAPTGVIFNPKPDAKWYVDKDPKTDEPIPGNKWDLLSVALHEIGHVLGLGHDFGNAAVMNNWSNGDRQRPSARDAVTAQIYYPSPLLQTEPILTGIFIGENAQIGDALTQLSQVIKEDSGYEIKLEAIPDPAAIISMLKNGQIDIAMLPYSDYFHNRDSLDATPLFVPSYEESGAYYRGAIIVRTDSGMQSLGDLKGTTFAYTNPGSLYGYLMPRALLASEGYDLNGFFNNVFSIGGSPTNMIMAVLNREADAGVIWADEKGDARRAVEQVIPDVWETIKILAYTPRIPYDVIVIRSDHPVDHQRRLQVAFLEACVGDRGRTALNGIDNMATLTLLDNRFWDAAVWLQDAERLDVEIGPWP
jgi:phosphonate transport system substrate-binding protein